MSGAGSTALALLAAVAGMVAWPLPGEVRGRPDAAPPGDCTPLRRRRASRETTAARSDVADLIALLAAPLRAGVAPSTAVCAAIAAAGPLHHSLKDLLGQLRSRAEAGETLAVVWLARGAELGSADLVFVGHAWLLTERTGAPLAPALAEAERVLRGRARARARLDAVAAGPRASMTVLSLLPLSGPVVGAAFGLGPSALYLASPLTAASGVLGVGLAAFGWWWGRRILARAIAS